MFHLYLENLVMITRTVVVAATALAVVACSESNAPTSIGSEDQRYLVPTAPSLNFVEGQYPETDEYLAAGGSLTGSVAAADPTGSFNAGVSSWSSSGTVRFQYVNQADAALNTSIISSDGATVNSGGQTYSYGSTIPMLSMVTQTLNSTISTNNNTCGITGKARLIATASLRLIQNPTNITLVWSGNLDRSAPDVTLPLCIEENEEETNSGTVYMCGGEFVDDPSSCESEPGSGGGGGGGEQGPAMTCELWRVDTYESTDGGNTWQYVETRYEVRYCH